MAVKFNEPTFAATRVVQKPSFLARIVIGTGLARTGSGAQVILLVIGVLLIAGASFFFTQNAPHPLPSPSESQLGNLK